MLTKVQKLQHKPLTFSSLQIPKPERARLRTGHHTLFRTVELDTLHRAGVACQTLQNRQTLHQIAERHFILSYKQILGFYHNAVWFADSPDIDSAVLAASG